MDAETHSLSESDLQIYELYRKTYSQFDWQTLMSYVSYLISVLHKNCSLDAHLIKTKLLLLCPTFTYK